MAPSPLNTAAPLSDTPANLKQINNEQVTPVVTKLFQSADQADADQLVSVVKSNGPDSFVKTGIFDAIKSGLANKKDPLAREAALVLISTFCESGVAHTVEPYIVQVFGDMLDQIGDAKSPKVRSAAIDACKALVQVLSPFAFATVLAPILDRLHSAPKWQVKQGCCTILDLFVTTAPFQVAACFPQLIPVVSEAMWDTKADVKKAARETMSNICTLITNKDIEKFIPALISAIVNPVEEVPKCILLLSATTFVTQVEAPTLALIAPLLERGLAERPTVTKRKTCVIIDNMSKLVDDKEVVRPFLPKLLPGLKKIEDTVADPEVREVVKRALNTLLKIGDVKASEIDNIPVLPKIETSTVLAALKKSIAAYPEALSADKAPTLSYAADLCTNLIHARNFELQDWQSAMVPYITSVGVPADQAENFARDFALKMSDATLGDNVVEDDEEEGEDLCNCTFSLAYGAKILLNTATMRLKKGHRYGLCGRNGTGKSTLMRAIANEQVENFPPRDELKTVYVEHDIDGTADEVSVLKFVTSDPELVGEKEADIVAQLADVGFDDEKRAQPISALSGGWKMKLALARAILKKAQILLLDEPTNHLDVVNVEWLMNYLTSLTDVTSIIVSHDSAFLDTVCTDIIHIDRFKLRRYKGNLSEFVRRVPEAKSYHTLEASDDYMFKFPEPLMLEGVKTMQKAILKAQHVGFQYPGTAKPQITDANFQLSLSSRVAILGPNGSGKSTLVKLLTRETEPNKGGTVWAHPNLVVGYIAQHAFHHIDNHLDSTAMDYIQWRYATGEDREEMDAVHKVVTEDEEAAMAKPIVVDGEKRFFEELAGRRKLKNSYEYEVRWKGKSSVDATWFPRDKLMALGFQKKINQCDSIEAQKSGMLRKLIRSEIEQHFKDCGLDPEFAIHNNLRGLSGGQKVKVVLACALWRR